MNKEELLIAITKELQLYNKVSLHTMGNISDLIDRYHQTEVKKLDKPVVMQAEGSDVSEGAAVGNSAAGKGVCGRFYTDNEIEEITDAAYDRGVYAGMGA